MKRWVAGAMVSALFLAACGSSVKGGAEDLIEGKLETQIDLGKLTATCEDPPKKAKSETFECTATTEDGRTLRFLGTMKDKDSFEVVSTNLLTAADVDGLLPPIAQSISNEVGADVSPADITCPEGSIILDSDDNFSCEIVDSDTGQKYRLVIKTGGLEPGGGPKDLAWEIVNLP